MCQPPSFYCKNANSICTHKQKDYDVIYIYETESSTNVRAKLLDFNLTVIRIASIVHNQFSSK